MNTSYAPLSLNFQSPQNLDYGPKLCQPSANNLVPSSNYCPLGATKTSKDIQTRKDLLGEKRDATSLVLEDIFLKFKVKA
jgi:hypothetical protein